MTQRGKSNIPPRWKTRTVPSRAKRLDTGLYSAPDAGGTLYIDAAELLKAHGIEPTLENQERLLALAREVATEQGGKPIDVAWFE